MFQYSTQDCLKDELAIDEVKPWLAFHLALRRRALETVILRAGIGIAHRARRLARHLTRAAGLRDPAMAPPACCGSDAMRSRT